MWYVTCIGDCGSEVAVQIRPAVARIGNTVSLSTPTHETELMGVGRVANGANLLSSRGNTHKGSNPLPSAEP
jgi:hypothetical protein